MFGFGVARVLLLASASAVEGGAWPRAAALARRCEGRGTEDPGEASVIVALGAPEGWPLLVDEPAPGALAWVWLPSLAEAEVYRAALERLPHARFCHGVEGLERLEELLGELGVEGAAEGSWGAVGALRAEYLAHLEQELGLLRRASAALGPPRMQVWSRFLLGVVASASAYELEGLARAASEALEVMLEQRQRPEAAREVVALVGAALGEAKARAAQAAPWGLEALEEEGRALWLTLRPGQAQEARAALGEARLSVVCLERPEALLDALELTQPDALVIDQALGAFDGLDLVGQVRAVARYESLPVVALLAEGGAAAQERALLAQVDRWLSPPWSPREVAGALWQLLRRLEVWRRLGGREPGTGLYTKEALKDRLHVELVRAQRSGQSLALMMIRVEAEAGEREDPRQLMGLLAQIAQQTFRRSDLLARQDAQTLVAALPECDARVVLALGRRLGMAAPQGVRLHIAASLGDGAVSPRMLLADAEARLRAAIGGRQAAAVGHCARPDFAPEGRRDGAPRVLLVDTEEALLNLLGFFCRREGFTTAEARDGAAALRLVEEAAARGEAPDAVLLEVHLPGLDGFQVLEALHQRHGARMAVLLMSVQHGGERVARAFQLGASDFVSKPFQVPEVMARLRNALVRAGAL
jgi:DNA-binding response OmpR family regulator